ncbi:hypothetical protein AB0J80_27680 [Actinoplanes sp. NPDC049548]|uniref:hypothetical protein n=1 Tax=Actinoplanes sp. NPDC049548 TaxID=3155152 RepID=UPI00341788DC
MTSADDARIEELIERSSLGTPEARAARDRVDESRVVAVQRMARLRDRVEHAAQVTDVVAAAVELVDLLEESGRVHAVSPVFAAAITACRPQVGAAGARRLIAERYRATERPVPAILWFVDAAKAGDRAAFDEAFALLRELDLPPAGADMRERLVELVEPQRKIVAMTTFLDVELPEAAQIAGMSPEATRTHELAGLATLAGRAATGTALLERPVTAPLDPPTIGGVVRTGGFDADFEDPANMPGQVIGGTLSDDERAMIRLMDPKDRARYLLRKRIQEKAEMAVLLSELQSLRHRTALAVIADIR